MLSVGMQGHALCEALHLDKSSLLLIEFYGDCKIVTVLNVNLAAVSVWNITGIKQWCLRLYAL